MALNRSYDRVTTLWYFAIQTLLFKHLLFGTYFLDTAS